MSEERDGEEREDEEIDASTRAQNEVRNGARPEPGTALSRTPMFRGASFAVLFMILACLGGMAANWIMSIVRGPPEPPAETLVVRPGTDVVVAVRDLARLESTSYHMERVIDLTARQRRIFGLVEAEDSILLVAAADITAGVDLSEMEDGDVTIDLETRTATITLPPVRVLDSSLDNDRTYVHHRQTDLLARRRESLETEARQEAERTLERAAIQSGILDRARANASRTIEALVRSLGYRHVIVRYRDQEG
jgi:hypothetical protein